MPAAHDPEALGDWNDLKGAYYHFIYTLWSLFCDNSARVAFFEGNDLRFRPQPIAPVLPEEDDEGELPSLALAITPEVDDLDIWVQLKATTTTWTGATLISDNMMVNFLCNALTSERLNRRFNVRLVTQAAIKRNEVEALIKRLDGEKVARTSLANLNKAIDKVISRYHASGESMPSREWLLALARKVLIDLKDTVPISQRALKAEIERNLYRLYPDPATVQRVKDHMLGALLDDVHHGPTPPRDYDQAWLEKVSGVKLFHRGILDDDAVAACEQVLNNAARDWDRARCIPRVALRAALGQFLMDEAPLFVLLGAPGTGVSWGIFDWAKSVLAERVRLLIPGSALDPMPNLASIVANALQRVTPIRLWTAGDYLNRLQAAAADTDRGSLVVIVDGLLSPASHDRERFRLSLARLTTECRNANVKLVLTCHTSVWVQYALGQEIASGDLFISGEPSRSTGDASGWDTVPGTYASFTLGDLDLDEMVEIVERRLGTEAAALLGPQLSAAVFRPLRVPNLLNVYLAYYGDQVRRMPQAPFPEINRLLDDRVAQALNKVSRDLGCRIDAVRDAFEALVKQLWASRLSDLAERTAVANHWC